MKTKRWRAKEGERFYIVASDTSVVNFFGGKIGEYENDLFECGNYFKTEDEALAAAKEIRRVLTKNK